MSLECMDWVQEQADEIEAIRTMYEDEWRCVATNPPQYILSLPVGVDKSRSLDIEVTFPNGYPTKCPIHISIRSEWVGLVDRNKIDSIVSAAKCRLQGTCQVYEIIVAINEYFGERHFEESIDLVETAPILLQSETKKIKPFYSSIRGTIESPIVGSQPEEVAPIEIFHGERFVDRKSIFQAHMARVKSKEEVENVLGELKSCKNIANATHNVYAYRITTDRGTLDDCDDDGETAAGSRMLHLLHILDVSDVLVVVTRWFGGVLLGPDRFRDYNNCCRNILDQHGLIKEKSRPGKKPAVQAKAKR